MPKTNTNPATARSNDSVRSARTVAKPHGETVAKPHVERSAAAEQIRQVRRQRWQWNGPLALWTVVVLLVLGVLAGGSYFYNSQRTANTLLQRAEQAADAGNYSEQAKWLRRYSLLKPDDLDAVVDAATAADQAADRTSLSQRASAVDNARKQLSRAIGLLATAEDHTRVTDLRTRLIKRLLQLGGHWFREAEQQVVRLDADPDDPQATKWLAQALTGQVNADMYMKRQPPLDDQQQTDYWNWLAGQPVGDVLVLAVERNAGDLDLLAALLTLVASHPEYCVSGADLAEQQRSLQETKQKLASAFEAIGDNQDGRSQLLVYQLKKFLGEDQDAEADLFVAAEQAAERLALPDSELADDQDPKNVDGTPPSSTWDYFLVLEAAKVAVQRDSASDRAQAAEWLELLTSLQLDAVPPTAVENAFVTAGILQELLGHPDQAIEIWERGLKQVNPRSLSLLWPLANASSQGPSDEQAAEAIDRFGEAVERARTRWLRTTVYEASRAERVARGRQLDVATWRHAAMQAILQARQGQRPAAISGLTKALYGSDDLPIEANERLKIAVALAELCKAEGLWDQAAQAYDRAIDIEPGNLSLRAASAEAWTRSGDRVQAMEHWRIAGNSDFWSLQLQSTNALFEYQLGLLPSERDFSGVRAGIERLRRNLPLAAEITDEKRRREVELAKHRLELLEVSVPPLGVSLEEHLSSAAMTEEVADLAAKYPDDGTVQAFAAARLAAAGKVEPSKQALARVEAILGPSVSWAILKARIAGEQEGPKVASELLIKHVQQDDKPSADVLRMAAAYAVRANSYSLAYEALNRIPADQRSVTDLYTLTTVAANLPEDSEWLRERDKRLTPNELSLRWERQLQQREGDSGVYGQYLKATRLLSRLYGECRILPDDNPAVEEAQALVRTIRARRPRWGEAISLEGWLSALQGQSEKAVQQLRRGIAAGDTRLQTRQRLIEQLYRLERYAEAEQEISMAAMSTELPIDKYAATRIELMQRQGDYERSLTAAESAVAQRPDDFVSHLVLAITASQAAAHSNDEADRQDLVAKARTALATASELSQSNEPRVFAARLQIEMAHGDEQSVRAETAKIKTSSLDTFTKLALEGQALIWLQDYEAALPLLKQADKIKPSVQTHLALVKLYRQLQRHDEEADLLRVAHAQNPHDEGLRNDLAKALVARDGKDVDWQEVADLLASAKEATANNRFLYAMLLSSRGSAHQQNEAERILRELIEEQNESSDDAKRFLAVLLRKRLQPSDPANQDEQDEGSDATTTEESTLAEIRALYDSLTLRADPALVDLFRYADFLLTLDDRQYYPRVKSLLDHIEKQYPGTLPALEVSLRNAIANDQQTSVPDLVDDWMDEVVQAQTMKEASAATIAGTTLLRLSFLEAALKWLEIAYRQSPEGIANYVLALAQSGQHAKSVSVCAEHFNEHHDPISATLLVESLLHDRTAALSQRHHMLILEALDRHTDYAPLVESVATLRLQQNNTQEAITLYERVIELAPSRTRTLNNLAMAYSEIPGRAAEGLALIERAIELEGPLPELLDTKGVVLLKSGELAEAEATFRSAIAKSPQPGYQFHLIVALLAQQRETDARQAWQTLDLPTLESMTLTPGERTQLLEIKEQFGQQSPATTQQQVSP